MIVFPNCKINLGLSVTRRRNDGFHDLETVFYPVAFTDVLEVINGVGHPLNAEAGPEMQDVTMVNSGLHVDGNQHDNLCIKAYRLLQKEFPGMPPATLYLHKAIPMGAGLGGGSADGAFALRLLNDYFRLGLTDDRLLVYAVQLGSDCPFFLLNKPCYATGRGEKLEPLPLDLSGFTLLLVNPGIHINTGWAFGALNRSATVVPPAYPLRQVVMQPVATWKDKLVNDFEAPVFHAHPAILQIRESMYRSGALFASMSGSGSTVFGIFENGRVPDIPLASHYTALTVKA